MNSITAAADATAGFDPAAVAGTLVASVGIAVGAGILVAIAKLGPKVAWGIFSSLTKRG